MKPTFASLFLGCKGWFDDNGVLVVECLRVFGAADGSLLTQLYRSPKTVSNAVLADVLVVEQQTTLCRAIKSLL